MRFRHVFRRFAIAVGAAGAYPAGMATVHRPFSGKVGFISTESMAPITHMVAPAKDGTFHVVPPGTAPQVALDIRQKTCFDSERGVLGTANLWPRLALAYQNR